ncbi:GD16795 [Drosophila simulans]|uniref:GD16795 n=1 Tax=Drosophila simulans TaxID=7240 RepID=B4R5L3_DROSI|nr:GD16795 [Drosophila simulans]
MDARRQKRLGPAPIASFEKSFEDNATTNAQQQQEQQHHHPHPHHHQHPGQVAMMEQSVRNQTTMSKTTNRNRTAGGIEAPSIANASASASALANASTAASASAASASSSSSSSVSSATCSATIVQAKQRPPPLKTATTTVTTTLVSSSEGGHPIPPSAHPAGGAGGGAGGGANAGGSYRGATTLTTPFHAPHRAESRLQFVASRGGQPGEQSGKCIRAGESMGNLVLSQMGHRVGTGTLQETIGLGFREEGALELRSSTEELYFMDPEQKKEEQERIQQQQQQPLEVAGIGGASKAFRAASSAHSQADGMPGAGTVAANAALLEQVLLARKHDPTQAVLAEGIKVLPPAPTSSAATTSSRSRSRQTSTLANGERIEKEPKVKQTIGAQRRSTKSPGQMVVGKTASGTEYIRINLRPDHMYSDKGIASNERVVEAPNQLAPVYSKPASLSLQGAPIEEHRLTPTASPKPGRRLTSRSPSPATGAGGGAGGSVSRKSSFSSLFRLGKDSPDSPRETARSRSKSKERPATASGGLGGGGGSQNVTPSKQKSVLAIFKPGKRGSQSSKSSSPIESSVEPVPPPPPPAPGSGSTNRSRTPVGSRPGSRLRYYDEPVEGVIHIPLHTPPEEREARTLLQGIQQLTHAAQASMDPSPLPTHRAPPASAQPVAPGTQITATQLAAAAAALRPVAQRRVAQRPDLDAIQSLPSQEDPPTAPGEEQILQQPEPAQRGAWRSSGTARRHFTGDDGGIGGLRWLVPGQAYATQ